MLPSHPTQRTLPKTLFVLVRLGVNFQRWNYCVRVLKISCFFSETLYLTHKYVLINKLTQLG